MKFILLPLLLLSSVCFAQTNQPANPKIIPPSPNAASLGKFGDIPVSAYTGVPNISIPIYEIKSGDISVPVSVSYHASGIKISEESGRVGLGWALNAGGVISRTILGKDDLDGLTGNYHSSSLPELPMINPGDPGPQSLIQEGCNNSYLGSGVSDAIQEQFDFQPDRYSYNFLNYSGTFVLRRDKVAVLNKQEKIRIRCLNNNCDQWEVTAADGFIYEFGIFETSQDNESAFNHKSSWYLTKITSPKGDQVTFDYTTLNSVYIQTVGSFTETRYDNCFSYTAPNTPIGQASCPSSPPLYRNVNPGTNYSVVMLSQINFKAGSLRLSYSDREDIPNDKKIDKIELYVKDVKNPSGAQQLLRSWDFEYGYFEGIGDRDYTATFVQYESKRLKLTGITEVGINGARKSPYRFSYFNEGDNMYSIPAKTSFARDHWGFYNGKTGNSSLIPTYYPVQSSNVVHYYLQKMGDERNTNPVYASLFSLKDIQYPTGGKSEFIYESHDYDFEQSNIHDHSFFKNYAETFRKYPSPLVFPVAGSGDQIQEIDLSDLYIDEFSSTSMVPVTIFFRFRQPQSSCSGAPDISVTQQYDDGSIISGPTNPYAFLNQSSDPKAVCTGNGTFYGMTFTNSYLLSARKVQWKLHIGTDAVFLADVSVSLQYTALNKNPVKYAGGLRISKITEWDNSDPTKKKIRKYNYHFEEDRDNNGTPETYSYGKRMVAPEYSFFERKLHEECVTFPSGSKYCGDRIFESLVRSSESAYPLLGSGGGSPVTYDKVIELQGENGENGKTIFEYENQADEIWNYTQTTFVSNSIENVPRKPPVFPSLPFTKNGLLKRESVYSFSNNNYNLVNESIIDYQFLSSLANSVFPGFEIRNVRDVPNGSPPCASGNLNIYLYPVTQSFFLYQRAVTERNYSQAGTAYTEKVKTNTYGNPDHLQTTQIDETINNGESVSTYLKYPADYPDSDLTPATLEMKTNRFMHSAVLQKTVQKNFASGPKVIARDFTVYDFFNAQTHILPKQIVALESDVPLLPADVESYRPAFPYDQNKFKTKIVFDYTASGNIKQYFRPDNVTTSYLWGYFDELPIAEITNAPVSKVFYTGFEDYSTGVSSDAFSGQQSYSNSLSITLPSAESYILSYWKKPLGGQWEYVESTIASNQTIGGSGLLIDEVRLYPVGGRMTTYAYDPLVGVISATDVDSHTTRYEYDGLGRLWVIKDQEKNVIKRLKYHYSGE